MNRSAAAILKREIRSLKKMLALEINKTRWLAEGDVIQTVRAQRSSDRIVAGLRPLSECLAELDEDCRLTVEAVRQEPVLCPLYDEAASLVEQLLLLSDQNRQRVRDLMARIAGDLRRTQGGRAALRGYRPGKVDRPRLLSGNL